jgi:hypothetical protein
MDHSQFLKKLITQRKAFSTVIGTIFMVLVVMFLFFNVFMFVQSQDVKVQNVVSQSQQIDSDRNIEYNQVKFLQQPTVIQDVYHPQQFIVSGIIIQNNCPFPVKLVRLWIEDQGQTPSHANSLPVSWPSILDPGSSILLPTYSITIPGETSSISRVNVWFVTSRGNQILTPVYLR